MRKLRENKHDMVNISGIESREEERKRAIIEREKERERGKQSLQ